MAYVGNCWVCNRSGALNRLGFCSEECTVIAYEQLCKMKPLKIEDKENKEVENAKHN